MGVTELLAEAVSGTPPSRPRSLAMPDNFQLADNEQFEQRWYSAERMIFALMALLVLGRFAGVFGGGWLSKRVLSAGRRSIAYERFLWNQDRTELTISTPSPTGGMKPCGWIDNCWNTRR